MAKLLRANLFKLIKEKSFYIILGISAAMCLLMVLLANAATMTHIGPDGEVSSSALFTGYSNLINTFSINNGAGLLGIIAIAIYAAKEFTTGAIRNKIAVGHSRKAIFLSNVITSLLIAFAVAFVYLFIAAVIGIPVLGWKTDYSAGVVVRQIICGFVILITSACVTNFISMVTRGNSGILINILGTLVLTLVFTIMGMELSGNVWKVLNVISKLTYIGQSSALGSSHTLSYFLYVLISGIIVSGAAVVGGAFLFERLDLK